MSTNATDETGGDDAPDSRYADLTLDAGEYVVYDRQNPQAWLQSSVAVTLDDRL